MNNHNISELNISYDTLSFVWQHLDKIAIRYLTFSILSIYVYRIEIEFRSKGFSVEETNNCFSFFFLIYKVIPLRGCLISTDSKQDRVTSPWRLCQKVYVTMRIHDQNRQYVVFVKGKFSMFKREGRLNLHCAFPKDVERYLQMSFEKQQIQFIRTFFFL